VVSGITGMPALGHTAGHSIFRFTDGRDSLLTLGDLVHLAPLQLARPETQTRLDMDPALAARSRRRFLQEAASEQEFVIGSHMAQSMPSRLNRQGEGFTLSVV
jgi:glyoxylase-like metal-dependent hydrolase (beta-lactamase superfamily II)